MIIFLYICVIICFIDAYGYGAWDIFVACQTMRPIRLFTKKRVRHCNNIYLLIPAMNEVTTLPRLMVHLVHMVKYFYRKYFGVTCFLIFIDDGSNDGTSHELDLISKMHPDLVHVIHRKLPNAHKGKGIALNNGLEWINNHKDSDPDQTIVGVIDSDSTPKLDLLVQVKEAFDHSSDDIIQTSISINNVQSFLTIMQEFEFRVTNFLSQIMRLRLGSGLASGNGQFMTLKMTNYVHWRGSLLDDLEFSINGLLQGFYGLFLFNVEVPQEGVLHYTRLIKQRTRWCQGGMQCLAKYGSKIFNSSQIKLGFKIDLLVFMILPFFSILFAPCSLVTFCLLVIYSVNNIESSIIPILIIIVVNILITFFMIYVVAIITNQHISDITHHHFIEMIVGNMIYLWILAPVPYIALFRFITGHNNWSKTAH